jgi:hypothetical protein
MVPGVRKTFQIVFYTRNGGTHKSRPNDPISGGKIVFSHKGGIVYSATFTLTLRAGGKKGTFSGKLASEFGRTPFRGSFSC